MEIIRIPLSKIVRSENIRCSYDDGYLQALGDSLAIHQDYPIIVQESKERPGFYVVLDGFQRVEAAKRKGLAELDAIVSDHALSPADITLLQLRTTLRKDLDPYERSEAIMKLKAQAPDLTNTQISKDTGMSSTVLTHLTCGDKCIPAVQEAFRLGKIGLSDRYTISQVSKPEQERLLALKLSGATRNQIAGERKRKNEPAATVTKIKYPASKGSVIVSGDALSIDDGIELLSQAMKALTNARDKGLDAACAMRLWKAKPAS